LETEKAALRERRDACRANALATGQALIELAAASLMLPIELSGAAGRAELALARGT
jgi:hypothetical protein